MRIQRPAILIASLLILAIVLTALLFHYPITIIDALSGQKVPGFDLDISGWRMVFEPFIGLLLFFNQSFYAIKEFALLLVWTLVILLIYTVIKAIRLKGKQQRGQFIFHQLLNMILATGIWFSIFVVMIFIPLPNNTIVNNSPNHMLVTTHSHTEYSHDGLISQQRLWNWHKRNGFDAFFITDHNNHGQTLAFVGEREKLAETPNVFGGEEFSGTNHLSLLGLKSQFRTKGYTDSMAVRQTRMDGGAIIVNHWFDGEHKSLEYYRDLGVDGFEIENTATDKRYDRAVYEKIREFCYFNRLIMVGGLDFHGYGSACTIWNAFEVPDWKRMDKKARETAVLAILTSHDQGRLNVLLYNDRPYYSQKGLVFSTPVTIFNYFRTLNLLQVISWISWIFLFLFIRSGMTESRPISGWFSWHRTLPFAGILGSLFLLSLGLIYLFSMQKVEDFTSMFGEYSSLLLKAGSAFLLVSAFSAWFRHKQTSKNQ